MIREKFIVSITKRTVRTHVYLICQIGTRAKNADIVRAKFSRLSSSFCFVVTCLFCCVACRATFIEYIVLYSTKLLKTISSIYVNDSQYLLANPRCLLKCCILVMTIYSCGGFIYNRKVQVRKLQS